MYVDISAHLAITPKPMVSIPLKTGFLIIICYQGMLITSRQGRFGNKIGGFCHAEHRSPKWSIKRPTISASGQGRCWFLNEEAEADLKVIVILVFPLRAALKMQTLNQGSGLCFMIINITSKDIIVGLSLNSKPLHIYKK